MGPKQCQVCNQAQSRYKCPSCLVPYCSLGCFKKHKEIPCAKPVPSPEISNGKSVTRVEDAVPELSQKKPIIVDASEVLLKSQLESIASSSEISSVLKDESIRKLICNVDGASDPGSELEKAMAVEAFRIFTDKILSTIDQ